MSHSRYIGSNKYLLEGREQRPDNWFSDRIQSRYRKDSQFLFDILSELKHECSDPASRRDINDLYRLAQLYIKSLVNKITYVRADYLSHVSPMMDNILEKGVLKVSRGHVANSHEKSPIEHLSGIVFAADLSGMMENFASFPMCSLTRRKLICILATFFCYTGYTHFVTLVVTQDGSEEDKYCSDKLVRIDMNDNLYFRAGKNEEVSFNMISGERIIVQIMYAHDIEFIAGDGRIWTMPVTPDFQRWENDSSEPWRWYTSCDLCNVNPCGRNGRYKNLKLEK